MRIGAVACLLGVSVLPACASSHQMAFRPHELRTRLAAKVPAERRGDLLVPFEVTPEMVARAADLTKHPTSDRERADKLVRAVTDANGFNVKWEPVTTTVPRETLEQGRGNCLSMTSLYIGLARGLGLDAYYVDASDRVNSLTREEALLVDTGHIVATVRTERGWTLIDFTGEITGYRTFRMIDDVEALAHFYNNHGFEIISDAQRADEPVPWEGALRDFTMATLVQPGFTRALNNQGVALSRLGRIDEAEQAYLRAAAADRDFSAPRHNLGNLHLRRKDYAQAIRWYGVAIAMESKNPYLRYHLGLALYQSGDVAGAIPEFERAIKLKHDYEEPRNLLAQAYRQQGRLEEAERIRRSGL